MIVKIRKIPVIVEGILWDGTYECAQEINVWNNKKFWKITDERRIVIPTLGGLITADVGDWIIKGVEGEFYPCKSTIKEKTYEEVED